MDINTLDGTINKFLSIEYTAMTSKTVPVFKTWGALYYDKQDYYDGNDYIYEAMIMNSKVQMVRVLVSTVVPVVDWSYEFYSYTDSEATDIYRRKEP